MKKMLSLLGGLCAVLLVLFCFLTAVDNVDSGRTAENAEQLSHSLRRAAAACYAAEGAYPENLAYLEEHYGIQIDPDYYSVIYQPIGSNLMPEITVIQHHHEK